MSSLDFVKFSLQIAVMLLCALFFGQVMRRLKQPPVLGEIIGGILLGPTLLGVLLPTLYGWLFQSSPAVIVARDASIKLGMLFFLFVVGLEINMYDLSSMGRKAIFIGIVGTFIPIIFGVGLVYAFPRSFWGPLAAAHFFSFALFIGMNLANSANPVIARVLMDLGILKGRIGTLIMTASIIDDLVDWSLLAFILSDILPNPAGSGSLVITLALILLFFIVVLGVGRVVSGPGLRWVRQNLSWPVGFIAVTILVVLIASSISEWLGINAFLGALLVGVALGGSGQEHQEAHDVISHFVLSFFAPIYFVSMGMSTNFVTNFSLALVLVIMAAAFISKMGGVLLGARIAGSRIDRESWSIAFGLNARGATGIILASVGLADNVIDNRMYVALVIMAVVTSLVSGPAISSLLRLNKAAPIEESTNTDESVQADHE